jgi:hypothetical protein
MVLRKTRHPRRYQAAAEPAEQGSESVQESGDTGVLTRRMSTGRRAVRSDVTVKALDEGRDVAGGRTTREASRNRSGRNSDVPRVSLQDKTVSLLATAANSPKATAEQTPTQSASGSVSGTSATQRVHKINTRSKGTCPLSLLSHHG